MGEDIQPPALRYKDTIIIISNIITLMKGTFSENDAPGDTGNVWTSGNNRIVVLLFCVVVSKNT